MRSCTASLVLHRLAIALVLAFGIVAVSQQAAAQPQGKKGNNKLTAPPPPPESWRRTDAWKDAPSTPLQPGEIDQLLEKELQATKLPPAPLTTDEQFLRRACLDLTGRLPNGDEIEPFLVDKDSNKRAKLIDKLLDSD